MPFLSPSREIFQKIIKSLHKNSPQTLRNLAMNIGMPAKSLKRYIEIIMDIQAAPEVEWTEVEKNSELRIRKDDFRWNLWNMKHK